MRLNEAVSIRVKELLEIHRLSQYQLHINSGVPKSTISNIVNCNYPSVKLRVLHEICQGLGIGLIDFFNSNLFDNDTLEP